MTALPPKGGADDGVRLQKWLAEAGLCSRRQGESWILAGRIAINGEVVTRMGVKVLPGDEVMVDGAPVLRRRQEKIALALYKPAGVLCTRHDPEGRKTVFDLLGTDAPRLVSVGRLDYNSEGLLLLTNDGLLTHRLMHPSLQVPRTYRVRVHGRVEASLLARLQAGVLLEDGPTGPLEVVLDRNMGANSWLTLTLHEGRNRMVRRIFAAAGMDVARLIRTAYGGVELGELEPGSWRPLSPTEWVVLRQAAGFTARPLREKVEVGRRVRKAPSPKN